MVLKKLNNKNKFPEINQKGLWIKLAGAGQQELIKVCMQFIIVSAAN